MLTTNTDGFAMSRYTIACNSMFVVDGVPVGLDDTGAFALDGPDDDGADFDPYIETGWTDFSEYQGQNAEGAYQKKRVMAVFAIGQSSAAMTLGVQTEDGGGTFGLPLDYHSLNTGPTPHAAKALVPHNLKSVRWKFRFGSSGPGVWRLANWRVAYETLKWSY